MKTQLVSKSRKQLLLSASALLVLAACSGGGDGPAPTLLSGAVIDGYIEGAQVCLDLNSNGACDVGEPSDTSKANGSYTLDITGINSSGLTLVADIPGTAKDSDDAGKTLAETGKSAYRMVTLADKPAVITPLTSRIIGKARAEGLTLAQATPIVLDELKLPSSTDPYEDHVAQKNTAVIQAARSLAGELQKEYLLGTVSKTSTAALNMPKVLADVASGQLIAYKMPSTKGEQINATAMIFKPTSARPSTGWPMVVFGHGTEGVGPQCAPSVTLKETGQWDYAPLVASLVASGMVVVAPDYEGLGSPDMGVAPGHPYLNLRSAGQSMALAAVAAKKRLSSELSGAWAAVGHSQGGHAALAGAQFSGLAKQLAPDLQFKGTVAIAPASNLLQSLNTTAAFVSAATPALYQDAYAAVGVNNLYGAYLVKGSESTPTPITASSVLGNAMLGLYNSLVESTCLSQFATAVSASVGQYALSSTMAAPKNYPGLNVAEINAAPVAAILAANEPGQFKLPGSTLIVQGGADTTVLPSITNLLVATMKGKGSEVVLAAYADPAATHSGVLSLPAARAAISSFLGTLFGFPAASGAGS